MTNRLKSYHRSVPNLEFTTQRCLFNLEDFALSTTHPNLFNHIDLLRAVRVDVSDPYVVHSFQQVISNQSISIARESVIEGRIRHKKPK